MLRTGLGFGLASIIAIAAGLQSEAIPLIKNGVLSSKLNFERASEQTYIDSGGILRTAASNVPVIDYTTGRPCLALDRKGSTNIHPWSWDLSKWTGSIGTTVTLTAEQAPDGSTDKLYRLNRTLTTAAYRRFIGLEKSNALAENVSVSFMIKKDDARYFAARIQSGGYSNRIDQVYDFDNNANIQNTNAAGGVSNISRRIYPIGNGFYIAEINFTSHTSEDIDLLISFNNDGGHIDAADSSDSVGGYFFGAQVEIQDSRTPFIYTNGTAQARAESKLFIDALSGGDLSFINETEGTFLFDFVAPTVNGTSQLILNLRNVGDDGGRAFLEFYNSGLMFFGLNPAGGSYGGLGSADLVNRTFYKSIFGYKANDHVAIIDNQDNDQFVSTSRGGINTLEQLFIGDADGTNFKCNYFDIQNLIYIPRRITDSEITAYKQFTLGGDSYTNGANGIGIKQYLNGQGVKYWNTALGGSTLDSAVTRLENITPRSKVLFMDGSPNRADSTYNETTRAADLQRYKDLFTALNGNIIIATPILFPANYNSTVGNYTLALSQDIINEFGYDYVIDSTKAARRLSGLNFTDPQDSSDLSYNAAAYDALFQADNIHMGETLQNELGRLFLILAADREIFTLTNTQNFTFTDEKAYSFN